MLIGTTMLALSVLTAAPDSTPAAPQTKVGDVLTLNGMELAPLAPMARFG